MANHHAVVWIVGIMLICMVSECLHGQLVVETLYNSMNQKYLEGVSLGAAVKANSAVECLLICLADASCKSVNNKEVSTDNLLCVLNSKKNGETGATLTASNTAEVPDVANWKYWEST